MDEGFVEFQEEGKASAKPWLLNGAQILRPWSFCWWNIHGYVVENNSHIIGLKCHPGKCELYSKGNSKSSRTKAQKSGRTTLRLLAVDESS